mgnify:CR=1 FL=1
MHYDKFAKYYDSFATGNSADIVRRMANEFAPDAKTLLDIACGTGNDLVELSKDYECTGIDISQEMLKIAQKKNKNITLYRRDMRDFNLDGKFDIIICMFDSINHLSSIKEVEDTLQCAKRHMHRHSVLIFDVNTFSYLESLGSGYEFHLENGIHLSLIPNKRIAHWKIMDKKGSLECIDEYFFTLDELKGSALKFFRNVKIMDENCEDAHEMNHRAYFVCQNP